MISWLLRDTKDGKLVWHKMAEVINKGVESREIHEAYQAAHSHGMGRRFGGAIVGFLGTDRDLCCVVIDGVGDWFYHTPDNTPYGALVDLFDAVETRIVAKVDCTRCNQRGIDFSSTFV
jgi:hypothetical protein